MITAPYEAEMGGMNPSDMWLFRAPSTTSAQMLDSESDFIGNVLHLYTVESSNNGLPFCRAFCGHYWRVATP